MPPSGQGFLSPFPPVAGVARSPPARRIGARSRSAPRPGGSSRSGSTQKKPPRWEAVMDRLIPDRGMEERRGLRNLHRPAPKRGLRQRDLSRSRARGVRDMGQRGSAVVALRSSGRSRREAACIHDIECGDCQRPAQMKIALAWLNQSNPTPRGIAERLRGTASPSRAQQWSPHGAGTRSPPSRRSRGCR